MLYVGDTYTGCIMYADDIVLIAASLTMLQKMIDIVVDEARNVDMLLFVFVKILSIRVFRYSCQENHCVTT